LRRLVRAPPEGPWGQWSSSRRRTAAGPGHKRLM
jgi:hypothetical protein